MNKSEIEYELAIELISKLCHFREKKITPQLGEENELNKIVSKTIQGLVIRTNQIHKKQLK